VHAQKKTREQVGKGASKNKPTLVHGDVAELVSGEREDDWEEEELDGRGRVQGREAEELVHASISGH